MTDKNEMKALQGGARVWYFPDGYLPEKVGDGPLEGHEALMLLNTSEIPAEVSHYKQRSRLLNALYPSVV